MEEFISNFHFLRPWYLLLLLLPLFFYGKFFRGLKNKSSWEGVCDKRLLDYLLIKGSSVQRKTIAYFAFIGFIGAILSLAGPSWQKKEIPNLAPENPVMLLLNMSTDMAVRDLTPNRLTRAKFEISDLLKLLHHVQAGLIVYSNEPFMISPITEDLQLIENLLPAVVFNIMPANGDRLDRAIALAVEKFRNAQYKNGNIIIFTSDVGERFDLALEEAKKAKAAEFRVSVASITAEVPEKLKLIAEAGGGIYTGVNAGDRDIEQIAAEIEKNISDELKISENMRSDWEDFGYYLLIIPLICCLYFFRKGILVITFLFFSANQTQAGFFLNDNQEGLKAYNAQDFNTAAQTFKDSRWKASALYKAGDYEKAYEEFAKNKDSEALYNQGNALAKSGKIEEAIKKYETVLEKEPNHEDAKFNMEYLKQQQQQQEQNQQQQQNQQNQEQNNQPQQNQSSENSEKNPNKQNQQGQNQDSNQEDNQNQSDGQNQDQQNQDSEDETQAQSSENQDNEKDNQKQPGEQENEMTGDRKETGEQKPEDEQKKAAGELQKGEEDTKYDEEVQARAQQYRDIPEDTGGLLRAFIHKEYRKNRYKE